jgi:hypothetical protein
VREREEREKREENPKEVKMATGCVCDLQYAPSTHPIGPFELTDTNMERWRGPFSNLHAPSGESLSTRVWHRPAERNEVRRRKERANNTYVDRKKKADGSTHTFLFPTYEVIHDSEQGLAGRGLREGREGVAARACVRHPLMVLRATRERERLERARGRTTFEVRRSRVPHPHRHRHAGGLGGHSRAAPPARDLFFFAEKEH